MKLPFGFGREDIVFMISFFILLYLIPLFLREWGCAFETGRLDAHERRIRTSFPSGWTNPVDVHDVPAPAERSEESVSE